MHMDENMMIVRNFIQKFWNDGDLSIVEEFITNDYVDHAYVPNNVQGLKDMVLLLQTAFPDQKTTEESIVAQGDRVMVRLSMRGTHKGNFRGKEATQAEVEVKLYREYRLRDGKIAEHWALFDTASLFRQIGAELHEQPACRINTK